MVAAALASTPGWRYRRCRPGTRTGPGWCGRRARRAATPPRGSGSCSGRRSRSGPTPRWRRSRGPRRRATCGPARPPWCPALRCARRRSSPPPPLRARRRLTGRSRAGTMAAMPHAGANGIEICYEETGDPGARPLLLIMGLGGQLIHWPAELVAGLAARGFRVITFDNRDVGLSTHLDVRRPTCWRSWRPGSGAPPEVPYLLTDMADDTAGLLDHLGIDRAHVVGVSLGGMVAQTLAIEHPDRVATLTSIMSTTGDPDVGLPTAEALAVLMAAAGDDPRRVRRGRRAQQPRVRQPRPGRRRPHPPVVGPGLGTQPRPRGRRPPAGRRPGLGRGPTPCGGWRPHPRHPRHGRHAGPARRRRAHGRGRARTPSC